METLTKENFWNEMEQKYPKAMAHFKEWTDEYKEQNGWSSLFNETRKGDCGNGSCGWPENYAPKYHELPIAMQFGIFLQFCSEWAIRRSLTIGDIGYTTPDFRIGCIDSITHLMTEMELILEEQP